jgi:hypothetical protein
MIRVSGATAMEDVDNCFVVMPTKLVSACLKRGAGIQAFELFLDSRFRGNDNVQSLLKGISPYPVPAPRRKDSLPMLFIYTVLDRARQR